MSVPSLTSLRGPYREKYLTYDELTAQLRAWAAAWPELCRLRSLGKSLEGRELWLLTLGPDPDRARPSVWIDGNMHATELCGSSVALALAEAFLQAHLEPDATVGGLSRAALERLREVRAFVLPRMCPDGAEHILRTAAYVRSNPRDRRPNKQHARWIAGDVDGDGLALLMRKRDPAGEFVESAELPGLLLPRTLDDEGPFYKVWPEGHIENFDGERVPDPYFLGDNDTDLNRNFPWSWAPEPEQVGAGAFSTSEPESRAVVEFTTAHPELFAWLNLHTFGGVYIRPLGNKPDSKMDPDDLAVFRQVAQWGQQHGGYPTVSGFEEFLYEPDKPLRGDLADYAYHQRGTIAYVCELWDLFAQLGFPRGKLFVDHYTHLDREQMLALGRWDRDHNQSRVQRPWKPCVHPQLGEVEVGGVDSRVGMSNPPFEKLAEVCDRQVAAFLRVAAMAPSVRVSEARVTRLGEGLHRVEWTVSNQGYLPTYVLSSSRSLPWNEPLAATLRAEGGAQLDAHEQRQTVGHLEGWGRGLYNSDFALFFQRSRGSVSSATVRATVRGTGRVVLRVGACRSGWLEAEVTLGA